MKLAGKIASALFSPLPVSRDRAIGLSERLAAATTLTSSLEILAQREQLSKGGLNDWSIAKKRITHWPPLLRRVINGISEEKTTTALHLARVAVSAGMLLPGSSRWRGVGSLFLGGTSQLLYPRHLYGSDGADQASALVQLSTGAARLVSSPQAKDALVWHVALQANLSYLTSGWVKLLGKPWRDASALPGVMRTHTYGHPGMFRWTQNHPRAAKLLTHGMLCLECLFPLAYLRGGRLARPVIASAAAFHLANGYFMGLNRFVTAFLSMHPAVAYTSAPRSHPAAAGRDDRVLSASLSLLAGATVTAAGSAVGRRLEALEGWYTSRLLTTRHGNVLQYEQYAAGDDERPVMVFVSGLSAPSECFAWITGRVARETGFGVVPYARAGQAGSRYRSTAPFSLSESVDDLVDLVNGAVAPHRKVILVGHSLGAEIARRAAAHLGDRLHGVVYLDPSHPDQLNRSEGQRQGAETLSSSLAVMKWYTRLGTGILLSRPRWIDDLPAPYRQKIFAQYGDARLWTAGAREWKAARADFEAFHGELEPLEGVPGLVISAQTTVDHDPEQLLMHKEIAEAHRGAPAETTVINDAGHYNLLNSSVFAHQVTDRIVTFFDNLSARPSAQKSEKTQQTKKTEEIGKGAAA